MITVTSDQDLNQLRNATINYLCTKATKRNTQRIRLLSVLIDCDCLNYDQFAQYITQSELSLTGIVHIVDILDMWRRYEGFDCDLLYPSVEARNLLRQWFSRYL